MTWTKALVARRRERDRLEGKARGLVAFVVMSKTGMIPAQPHGTRDFIDGWRSAFATRFGSYLP